MRARTKAEALRELAECLAKDAPDVAVEPLVHALEERERTGPSTGLELGVAIPHAKLAGLRALEGCFGRSRGGVDFAAHDRQPSRLFFLLVGPDTPAFRPFHLKALARVARLLRNPAARSAIERAESGDEIWRVLSAEDDRS
jgi:PTS system nitrogen regulatory IIA component